MYDLRFTAREKRISIPKNDRIAFTEIINDSILAEIIGKKNIMIYNAIDGEVEIFRNDNYRYIYPKIINGNIVPCEGNKFKIGMYNILEPEGNVFNGKIDAVVVPMCAFDENFNRIGFGKGYYDRFLADLDALKIGVAFSCQKVENITEKPSDVKMDMIITEKEVLKRI